MKMPFQRSKPLPERALDKIAAGAGIARLAIAKRTLHPRMATHKGGHGLLRRS